MPGSGIAGYIAGWQPSSVSPQAADFARTMPHTDDGGDDTTGGSPDEAAARRLIAKRQRDFDRIPDPRKRRERAYALLARNGFDPEVCRTVAASVAPPAARP